MDLVIEAVKNDLGMVLSTGRYMLGSLFLLAVVINYLGMLQNKAGWAALILRLALGFILLQNYIWVMDTSRTIIAGLDDRINPEQSYVEQYAQMSINMQKQLEDNTQQSLLSKAKDFLFAKFTLHNLVINLSFIFYAIVSKVMEAIRYCVIAILYKLGPVLIPLILFDSTRRVLRGWFSSYLSVLCWPILWHIVLSVAVTLSSMIGPSGEGMEQFAALNFSVCFVLMFTPMIVAGIMAGFGAGGAAALAGVMSSKMIVNTIERAGQAGRHLINRVAFIHRGGGALQSAAGYRSTPTVMKGKFRDSLIGKHK